LLDERSVGQIYTLIAYMWYVVGHAGDMDEHIKRDHSAAIALE